MEENMQKIIVSRHPAVVEFVRAERPDFCDAKVLASASPDDVRSAHVIGDLSTSLAALCGRYEAIEFIGSVPCKVEYTVDDMRACGAHLVEYRVHQVPPPAKGKELELVTTTTSSKNAHAKRMLVLAPRGTKFPSRGDWIDRGEVGRDHIFEFYPNPERPLAGFVYGKICESRGIVVAYEFIGHHESLTLYFAREGAVFSVFMGYKGRHQGVFRVTEGAPLKPADPLELAVEGKSLADSLAEHLKALCEEK
jgi:hypothetical protein